MSFEKVKEKIKNIKPDSKGCEYHKSILELIDGQKELMIILQKEYEENFLIRSTIDTFVTDFTDIVQKGSKFKSANESVKDYLKHYLFEFSCKIDGKNKKFCKTKEVSDCILNSDKDFLFIVKLLDNYGILVNVMKIWFGMLVQDLLAHKIYVNNLS